MNTSYQNPLKTIVRYGIIITSVKTKNTALKLRAASTGKAKTIESARLFLK